MTIEAGLLFNADAGTPFLEIEVTDSFWLMLIRVCDRRVENGYVNSFIVCKDIVPAREDVEIREGEHSVDPWTCS